MAFRIAGDHADTITCFEPQDLSHGGRLTRSEDSALEAHGVVAVAVALADLTVLVVDEVLAAASEAELAANRWAAFTDVELGDIAAGLHATYADGNAKAWPLLREAIAEIERRRP